MPINMLIVRGLLNLYTFYGDELTVECPTGSGKRMTLFEVARRSRVALASIFLRDGGGRRPVLRGDREVQEDPHWPRPEILFHEYFHATTGPASGSHQTGWTGVVARLLDLFGRVSAKDAPLTSKEQLRE